MSPAEARALAERIVAVHRAAYHDPDPLPGLPAADGAHEDVDTVARELAAEPGFRIAFAVAPDGSDVGVLRVVNAGGLTEVRRLAVVPAWASRGIAWQLADFVEDDCVAQGMRLITFPAVVERGRPQIWARRGFRVVARWPADDKPLTEVTMERPPAGPRSPLAFPWDGDDALPTDGVLVTWFKREATLVAAVDRISDDVRTLVRARALGGARWLGADVWPGGGAREAAALEHHLRAAGGPAFTRPLHEVPLFLMPRQVEPHLLALWRFAPAGIEIPPH